MSTTSMAIFSNPLFATYSVYAHNASIVEAFIHLDTTQLFLRYTVVAENGVYYSRDFTVCRTLNFHKI